MIGGIPGSSQNLNANHRSLWRHDGSLGWSFQNIRLNLLFLAFLCVRFCPNPLIYSKFREGLQSIRYWWSTSSVSFAWDIAPCHVRYGWVPPSTPRGEHPNSWVPGGSRRLSMATMPLRRRSRCAMSFPQKWHRCAEGSDDQSIPRFHWEQEWYHYLSLLASLLWYINK